MIPTGALAMFSIIIRQVIIIMAVGMQVWLKWQLDQ